jgi:ribosomal protein S8E
LRGIPTLSFLPFKSSHGHKFANIYSRKSYNLQECLKIIDQLEKKKLKTKKIDFKNIELRVHNLLSKKPGFKIIVDEFKKLQKIRNIQNKNKDLILKFKFMIRDFRSKILNYKYGNIKFSTFKKDQTLKIFKILKELNPKYNDLSIDFIKKDIIQINNND